MSMRSLRDTRMMNRSLRVLEDEVVEDVPALLNEVAIVGKGSATNDFNVLDFLKPMHIEDQSLAVGTMRVIYILQMQLS